jgi:tetratricopeptide (TPR) repeat protein
MGVWQPDTNFATVHYADYAELPAKKIWSWGVDPDGLDWRRALSDNNSAYVEVQAGLFRNQETYAFLEPRQTIRFSEYWMPARGLGGIARANLTGVLNLSRRSGELLAAFNANAKIPQASIRILQGARILSDEKITLTPDRTWTREIPAAPPDPCTFELRDAAGQLLLRQTEGQYDWTPAAEIQTGPQPVPPQPGALQQGTDQELQGELLAALRTYQDALRQSPQDFDLAVAAGRLCAALQRDPEAIAYLEPAAARATSNPEIAYYLGLVYDASGDFQKARTAYESAARMPSWRVPANLKLGELLARRGDLKSALAALHMAGGDLRAAEETEALQHAAKLKTSVPADPAASLFLQWDTRAHDDPALLQNLAADPARVLEVAAEYMRLGLYARALDILSRDFPAVPPDQAEPGAVLPQHHPLIAYYRGYCRAKLGASPAADYAAAQKLSTLYVFPSRDEDLAVLQSALAADPRDMTAHYLYGTQQFARGDTGQALQHWTIARDAGAPIPVLHTSIGNLLMREKHDSIAALKAFREGLPIDPLNRRLYQGIDDALSLMSRPARELAASLQRYPDQPNMPAELVDELALELAESQDFDAALALFHGRFFPREEGGTNVRQVWVEVRVLQSLAQAAANRCDSALATTAGLAAESAGLAFTKDGLQPFVDAPRTQYLIGQVESRCGQASDAAARWTKVSAAQGPSNLVWAWGAAKKLPGYHQDDWAKRFATARAQAASASPYVIGALDAVLAKRTEAWTHFQQSILQPDSHMSHHLTRMAMSGAGLPD